jgi:integrase
MNKGGKPRKHARVIDLPDGSIQRVNNGKGREITGLSYHSASGRYYRISPETGKREYLGRDLAHAAQIVERGEPANAVIKVKLGAMPTDQAGIKAMADQAKAVQAIATAPAGEPTPAQQKLSDCLIYWREQKRAEGRKPQTLTDVSTRFNRFVKVVGDKAINLLWPADFERWNSWTLKAGKGKSPKWYRDHHGAVKSVLAFTKQRKGLQDWPLPDGLLEWVDAYRESKAYQPEASNREALPSESFAKLLAACDTWAATDPEQFDRTTQDGRGKRLQAIRKQREGRQAKVMLLLACNAALDPVDLERLLWSDLHLTGKTPYFAMPRYKQTWKVGHPIARKTPLLPSVVAALKAWNRETRNGGKTVFRNAQNGSVDSRGIARMFTRLKKTAAVNSGLTFKHIRNVGPTLRKQAGLPTDMSDAILGHTVAGTSKYYEGDVDETYLAPVVNLIGKEYFGGETVQGTTRRQA